MTLLSFWSVPGGMHHLVGVTTTRDGCGVTILHNFGGLINGVLGTIGGCAIL